MKCDACGMESSFDAAFVKRAPSLFSRGGNICASCWAKRTNRKGLRFLGAIPVFMISGWMLQRLAPGGFWGEFLFNLALIQLFLVLSVVPHEMGHALTARALGWRVYQITIGLGPQVWKRKWWGVLIDFRALPIAGATFMVPESTRFFRLKFFLAILAGPLVNALMAGYVILAFGGSVVPLELDALPNAARLFVFSNFMVLLINLWPFIPRSGMALASDGKRLLQLVSLRKCALEEVHAMRSLFEAQLCRDKGDRARARDWCEKGLLRAPDNTNLLNWSGLLHLDDQNYAAARAVFLRLLEKEKHHSSMRSILLNNVAYADALSEDPALLPEADAYSRDAFTMMPWVPAVVGTRGTVLVALGRPEDGLALLKKSLEDSYSPSNKAENACHIAIALFRLGQAGEADKYLCLAETLDPNCPITSRARRMFSESGLPVGGGWPV